ncbi:MAG: preprotein translocase subunit YajC [Thermoleophilia bacterium]|nr:preprotein translocase subunit YajC [Thermoleophilia bacterium]
MAALTFILAQVEDGDGAGGFGGYWLFIYIALFIGIFYLLLIRPGQKQRKAQQQLVSAVKKGDQIMTAGGIYGLVTQVKDDFIMLEIAKKTEIKVSKSSVAQRFGAAGAEEAEAGEEPEPPEASGS